MSHAMLLARRYVVAGEFVMDVTVDAVGPIAVAVPAGNYYLKSATATESLVDAIDAALEAAFAGENFTVTFDEDTGFVTIACQTGSISVAWNTGAYGTGFRDWLGFGNIGNFGPVASQTADEFAQGVVYPRSNGRMAYEREERDKTVSVARAESGAVSKVAKTGRRRATSWSYEFEPLSIDASGVFSGIFDEDDSVRPWAWEDFIDHCALQPFRFYPDRSNVTYSSDSSEEGGTYDLDEATSRVVRPTQKVPGSEFYWIVRLGVTRVP